jgi:engulfment/cell motility protein 1
MWSESESRLEDFDRLSFLVRSQLRQSLTEESTKTWLNLERDFLEGDYRSIRDRQMELMEKEDGMMARPAIRELRDKLGREAYDALSEQR